MRQLCAKDIMSKDVVWVTEDCTVAEAADLFVEEMISGAPVVDDKGVMTGVVSLRDLVKNGGTTQRFVSDSDDGRKHSVFYDESWELPLLPEEVDGFHLETNLSLTVKEVMTPTLFNVDVSTPITEIAEMMLRGRIHRVIVLEGDDLAGIVTTMDMLRAITKAI